jgi:hypothetical protein
MSAPASVKILFFVFSALIYCSFVNAQSNKEKSVVCYQVVIKEPLAFYGNPGDIFTLYDGSRWRVLAGTQYEYIPLPYKDGLLCPEAEKLIISSKAMRVSKLN